MRTPICDRLGVPHDPSWGGGKLVMELYEKTVEPHLTGPVFVTDYPVAVRPFYHMRHAEQPGLTKSFDLLWKGIEITTGAQREHRYEQLLAQAADKGVEVEPIQYYLNFFRFGAPPHGGFGFGLTRLLISLSTSP